MNKKININYIKLALISFTIISIIIILWIININVKNSEKTLLKENNNTNNLPIDTQNIEEDDEFFEDDYDLFYDSEEVEKDSNAKNSYEQLDEMYDFEIKNIPNEVLEQINDMDYFRKEVKKYIYLSGIINETTEAEFYQTTSSDTLQENEIAMIFILNNEEQTAIAVKINTKTDEIEIDEVFE